MMVKGGVFPEMTGWTLPRFTAKGDAQQRDHGVWVCSDESPNQPFQRDGYPLANQGPYCC